MNLTDAIAETQKPDWLNPLFATLHARSKDSPAKTWWYAEPMHAALFRALKMNPKEEGAIFAAVPFRLHRDSRRILVAFPCPRILAPHDDDDWLGIETVLSWDPVTNTAKVMGDEGPALIGTIPPDQEMLSIFGSPFAFFRAFAEARAQWIVGRHMVGGDWRRKPREPDLSPGLLLLGKPDKVAWPRHRMPAQLVCEAVDVKALNRALIKQAHVPHASVRREQ